MDIVGLIVYVIVFVNVVFGVNGAVGRTNRKRQGYVGTISICVLFILIHQARTLRERAAHLTSKQLSLDSGYKCWCRVYFIVVWYARQAMPKRHRIDKDIIHEL